jgi:hypothetical protein
MTISYQTEDAAGAITLSDDCDFAALEYGRPSADALFPEDDFICPPDLAARLIALLRPDTSDDDEIVDVDGVGTPARCA